MKKVMKWLPLLMAVLVVTGMGVMNVYADTKEEETIFEGVYVNSISLAGMTEEEAESMIEDYVNQLLAAPITLTMGDRYVEIMPEDIGLTWMNPHLAKDAYSVGRCGNLIKRFKEQKDLDTASVELRTEFKADETLLRTLLEEKQETMGVEPENWGLVKEGDTFTPIPGVIGTVMDVDASYNLLVEHFANVYVPEKTEIELVANKIEPLGSEEELLAVKDLLGSFSTFYMTETEGRNQNVENGASKIDGALLYPGEEFSVHDSVSPFTQANGYAVGYAYDNGKVIESVGGGICQVSTTLYNAVLRAELEITQRAPHSMIVGYVQPAEDAAIAGTWKDLKFVNNLEHPIYIEGYTKGDHLYFNIYGVETRSANRKVEFVSETIEITHPEHVFEIVDETVGYINCVQDIHIGYKANLWKVVYENGVEVSREKVNYSVYAPASSHYEVGLNTDNEEAIKAIEEAIKESIATGNVQFVYDAVAKYSELEPEEGEEAGQGAEGSEGVEGNGGTTEGSEDTESKDENAGNRDTNSGEGEE